MLPARYAKAHPDTLDGAARVALEAVRAGRGAYLSGEVGTGKTYAAHAIMHDASDRGIRTHYDSVPWLLSTMRAAFSQDGGGAHVEEELGKRCAVRLLILDDLGAEKPTDWAVETLFRLVDSRYGDLLPTVYTSNLSLDALATHLGRRIADRIAETCAVCHLEGESRRVRL